MTHFTYLLRKWLNADILFDIFMYLDKQSSLLNIVLVQKFYNHVAQAALLTTFYEMELFTRTSLDWKISSMDYSMPSERKLNTMHISQQKSKNNGNNGIIHLPLIPLSYSKSYWMLEKKKKPR
jgi:hypothetical protein